MKKNNTSDFSMKKIALSFFTIFTLITSTLAPSFNLLLNDNAIVYADEKNIGGDTNVEETNLYYTISQYQQAVLEANKAKANNTEIPSTINEIVNEGLESGAIKEENGKYVVTEKVSNSNENNGSKGDALWTGYAKYIMGFGIKPMDKLTKVMSEVYSNVTGKKVKGTGEFENVVGSNIKSGSTKVEFQLADLSTTASNFEGNSDKDNTWLSRRLSSILGTWANYGYIETSDGPNEIEANFGEKLTSWIAQLCVYLNGAFDAFGMAISKVLFSFDPYSWLGWNGTENGVNSKNVIVRTFSNFLQSFGISKDVIKTIMDVTILFLAGAMCFVVLMALKKGNLKSATGKIQNIALRVLLLGLFIPVMATCTHSISNTLSESLGKTKFAGGSSEVIKHVLLDVEDWASSQNLSPTALNASNSIPDAKASQNYVDKSFIPSKKRSLIKDINDKSESILGEGATHKDGIEMLEAWANGEKFTVKSYVASVERNESKNLSAFASSGNTSSVNSSGRTIPLLKYNKDTWLIASRLSSYIWSLVDFRKDDSKNSGYTITEAHKATVYDNNKKKKQKDINYQEQKAYGVQSNQSFSTQSVVLMLQTAFNKNGEAVFRTLKISPSGQSKTQQVSSSPIAWRSVTMPSENGFAKFSSCLYLIAFLLSSTLISIAVMFGLFYSGFFKGISKWFRDTGAFLFSGDYGRAVSSICYYLAIMAIGLIGLNLSSIIVNLIMTISSMLAGMLNNDVLPSSTIDLIASIVGIGLSLFLAGIKLPFSVNLKDSPIAILLHMPLEMADNVSNKIMAHSGVNNRLSNSGSGFGKYEGASSRGESSFSHKANDNHNALKDKINKANQNQSGANANNLNSNGNSNANNNSKANNASLNDKLNSNGLMNNSDLNNGMANSDINNANSKLDDTDKLNNLNDNQVDANEKAIDNGMEKAPDEENSKLDDMNIVSLGSNGNKFDDVDNDGNANKNGLTPLEEADVDVLNRDKTSQFKETTSESAEKLVSKLSPDTIDNLITANCEEEAEEILLDDANGSYVASQNNIAKQTVYDEEENPNKFFLQESYDENGNLIGYNFDKDEFDEALRQTDSEIEEQAKDEQDKNNLLERRALAKKAFQEGTNSIYTELKGSKSKILSGDEYKEKIARGLVSGVGTRSYLRNEINRAKGTAKEKILSAPRYVRNSPYMSAMVMGAKGVNELAKGNSVAFTSALSEAKDMVKSHHQDNKIQKTQKTIDKQSKKEQKNKDKAQKHKEKSEKIALQQRKRLAEIERLQSKGNLNMYDKTKLSKLTDEINSAQKRMNLHDNIANSKENAVSRNVKKQAKAQNKLEKETLKKQLNPSTKKTNSVTRPNLAKRTDEFMNKKNQRQDTKKSMLDTIDNLETKYDVPSNERLNSNKASNRQIKKHYDELMQRDRYSNK